MRGDGALLEGERRGVCVGGGRGGRCLAPDCKENVVVVDVCVALEGEQARFGVGPVALVHGKSVTFCMVEVQCLGGEGR